MASAPHGLVARFGSGGAVVRAGGGRVGLALIGYGYGERLTPIAGARPHAAANKVSYAHRTLSEWYVNGPLGLEQGFTLRAPPAGVASGPLTLRIRLSGNLRPSLAHSGLVLSSADGAPALDYSGLAATDARGHSLRASLALHGRRLLIRVRDAGARYPVVVDPFFERAKLTASDGAPGDELGGGFNSLDGGYGQPANAVAISGGVLVAGAPDASVGGNSGQGAVYVFVKPAGGWATATETTKLTASDGAAGDAFGNSVAIDGNTVVVGAPGATVAGQSARGAAYVFVKPAGGWSSVAESAKLTASDGQGHDEFGTSVAISGDTVVAGALLATVGGNAYQGAAYVFVKPVGGWASGTETAKLTASNGASGDNLGNAVAISGDTVVAGAYNADQTANSFPGAAYVFLKPPTGWASEHEAAKLTPADRTTEEDFGFSVAISGNTVAVGAPTGLFNGSVDSQGALYVYVKPGSGWASTTETAKLSSSDQTDALGWSVAVSADEGTVVGGAIGHGPLLGQGAELVFSKPAGGWAAETESALLVASNGASNDALGISSAIEGDTVVAGASGANNSTGAVYVFDPYPYARPKGATPTRISLVPAYRQCTAANTSHGAPLSHPSCNPPVQASNFLTVGTPDSNGAGANATGFVLYRVVVNTAPTPNDVLINVSATDVRCKLPVDTTCGAADAAAGPDYTGQLRASASVRITDKLNGPGANEPGTVSDTSFPVTAPCGATASTSVGSTCSVSTSANAVLPGSVQQSGSRAIWQLGQVQVFDGGSSGTAGASDATLFEDEGVFVP